MRVWIFAVAVTPAFFLGACNLAPEYRPPTVEMPVKFKEDAIFKPARPIDDQPRGPWWLCFNDPVLNDLESQVDVANQDLARALAVFDQSRAYAAKAEAGLFPTVQLNNSLTANKQSQHRPFRKANTPVTAQGLAEQILSNRPLNEPDHYGNNILSLQASYEIDVWGRVRNAVAAGLALSEASAADFETIRLSLQSELARNYIGLRGLDSEEKLLSDTVATYKKALDLTRERVNGQIASPMDVFRAEAQLETARAQLSELSARRALFEHAIATLIGRPASVFAVPTRRAPITLPSFPGTVPSSLLQRRPDIAAAERRVAAANDSIGIARAAFFPRFTINLAGGTQDTGVNLLNFRNSIWSVGPTITLPIFDGGARFADLASAEAAYAETVAHYRGVVLQSIQDVEDNLATLRWLKREARSIEAAVVSTQRVLDISLTLYRDGAVTYLDVVSAQTAALDAQRTALELRIRQLQTAVALILALGGGWASIELVDVGPQ